VNQKGFSPWRVTREIRSFEFWVLSAEFSASIVQPSTMEPINPVQPNKQDKLNKPKKPNRPDRSVTPDPGHDDADDGCQDGN
jgi:hypothetical protein